MKTNKITIPRWFDRHLHIRDGEMLKTVLPCTINQRAVGAVIMGNLKHPDETSTVEKAVAYRKRINGVLDDLIRKNDMGPMIRDIYFMPRMTCYLTDDITPEEVVRGFDMKAWCAVKLYMANQNGQGGTTGSQHGVKNLRGRYPVFEAMQKKGIPLLGHFEAVEENVDEFDREIVSTERDLKPLLKSFPALPVVFEHLTDGRVADFIAESTCYNIQATVTAHHLMINRNAMFWGGMNPCNYCKPVPKREIHRQKIRSYATSGNPRFGAGTDSAPHDEQAKSRCYGCAAGIFTAPIAVELYTTVFAEENALQHLGSFLSENFLSLYGMKVSSEMMEIEQIAFSIPQKIETVKVFKGGEFLYWKIVS
ncbi:MAG: dihydroorotase [Candidatus Paceibacterota bacterium]|jgi:dihydroorotase